MMLSHSAGALATCSFLLFLTCGAALMALQDETIIIACPGAVSEDIFGAPVLPLTRREVV